MKYAQIREMDITNGQGIACSLFVQGCSHHCKGCFNSETWDFNRGKEWTKEIEDEFIKLCNKPYVDCVSILGGEPFDQDIMIFIHLLNRIKQETNKPIYIWSGYTYEQLLKKFPHIDIKKEVFSLIDYLIDGEFQSDKKDLSLKLRGSSNQRIIDVQKTLSNNKVITI